MRRRVRARDDGTLEFFFGPMDTNDGPAASNAAVLEARQRWYGRAFDGSLHAERGAGAVVDPDAEWRREVAAPRRRVSFGATTIVPIPGREQASSAVARAARPTAARAVEGADDDWEVVVYCDSDDDADARQEEAALARSIALSRRNSGRNTTSTYAVDSAAERPTE